MIFTSISRLVVTNSSISTIFDDFKAQRADSGTYTLTLVNGSGRDVANVSVLVTGMCTTGLKMNFVSLTGTVVIS